ncbi:MAG: hypothetical protein CR991_09290 [Proteobacteria bacterium]|nr:MAG: hypothetical protein CR991_09290 [Pseudomonadota bacterium]
MSNYLSKHKNPAGYCAQGQQVDGRYTIQSLLSKSSLGELYIAQDEQTLEGEGHATLILLFLVDLRLNELTGFSDSFQRVLTEFVNKHLDPSILNNGITDKGQHWYAAYQYPGELLSQKVAALGRNGLDVATSLEIAEHLLRTIKHSPLKDAYAYLEPETIWLANSNQVILLSAPVATTLKLLSLGNRNNKGRLTLHSSFISPEAAMGNAPASRDDTFSFACIIYYMLNGHLPFVMDSSIEAAFKHTEPATVAKLPNARWKALQRGMSFTREARQTNPDELLYQLNNAEEKRPLFLRGKVLFACLSFAVLLIAYGTFAFYQSTLSQAKKQTKATATLVQQPNTATEQKLAHNSTVSATQGQGTVENTLQTASATTQTTEPPSVSKESSVVIVIKGDEAIESVVKEAERQRREQIQNHSDETKIKPSQQNMFNADKQQLETALIPQPASEESKASKNEGALQAQKETERQRQLEQEKQEQAEQLRQTQLLREQQEAEAKRLAEQQREKEEKAEAERLEQARLQRLAAERQKQAEEKAEAERLEQVRLHHQQAWEAEQKRLAAERQKQAEEAAEAERLEQARLQRLAAERQKQAEKAAEAERLSQLREQRRREAEQRAKALELERQQEEEKRKLAKKREAAKKRAAWLRQQEEKKRHRQQTEAQSQETLAKQPSAYSPRMIETSSKLRFTNPRLFGPVSVNKQAQADSACRSIGGIRALGYHPHALQENGLAFPGGAYYCQFADSPANAASLIGSQPSSTAPRLSKKTQLAWDKPAAFGSVPSSLQARGNRICQGSGFSIAVGYHPKAYDENGRAMPNGGYLCQ